MITLDSMKLDTAKTCSKIEAFILGEIDGSGLRGAVVSVSGGIDSAVALALTVRALGPGRVRALTMPERDITPEVDLEDVMSLVTSLGVTCDTVEITAVIDVMRRTLPEFDNANDLALGNLKPRIRMAVAYYYANSLGYMVMGSSNRTELLTGYFTKYGDGGVDLMPLGDLYKNQIRQLASYLDIPTRIQEKKPSAGLWPGQTDEGEMGVDYDTLDIILYGLDRGMTWEEVSSETGVEPGLVERFAKRVEANEHKRRLPNVLRLRTASG